LLTASKGPLAFLLDPLSERERFHYKFQILYCFFIASII